MDTTPEIPCPVPGHNDTVRSKELAVCGRAWTAVTRMCRGKWRRSQFKAEEVTSHRPWLTAYPCDVCREWHNGNITQDRELIHQMVRDTLKILIEQRGPDWLTTTLFTFDPANGYYSRSTPQASDDELTNVDVSCPA